MTEAEFAKLKEGDIVRNRATGNGYVVTLVDGKSVIVTSTATITNPSEWDIVHRWVG